MFSDVRDSRFAEFDQLLIRFIVGFPEAVRAALAELSLLDDGNPVHNLLPEGLLLYRIYGRPKGFVFLFDVRHGLVQQLFADTSPEQLTGRQGISPDAVRRRDIGDEIISPTEPLKVVLQAMDHIDGNQE